MSDNKKGGGRPDPKQFVRVKEAKPEGEDTKKGAKEANEIRVVASRGQRMYIKYAIELLNGEGEKTKVDSVILSGMGNATYNVVNVVEILKRRVKGLYQTTEIGSQTMTDKYEAIEEGKPGLEVERKVSIIEIVLSTKQLDVNHCGYQAPLPESEVVEEDDEIIEQRERRPRRTNKKKVGGGDRKPRERKEGDADRKPREEKEGDEKKEGGGRRRGGRGGDRKEGDGDRKPREDRDERAPRGGRGGGDRKPREERKPRDDRDDRAPARGGRGGRGEGGRGEGGRGGRGEGGRGGYSEGRREGGRGGGEARTERGGRRN